MYLSVVYFEMLNPSFSFFFSIQNICFSLMYANMSIYSVILVSVASLFFRDAP